MNLSESRVKPSEVGVDDGTNLLYLGEQLDFWTKVKSD